MVLAVCDFNLPILIETYFSTTNNDRNAFGLLAFAFNPKLVQVVQEATKVHGNCRNLIDLVFRRNNISSFNYGGKVIECISDPGAVVRTLSCCDFFSEGYSTKMPDFNSADGRSIIDVKLSRECRRVGEMCSWRKNPRLRNGGNTNKTGVKPPEVYFRKQPPLMNQERRRK